jgi:hypothetical protein
MGVEQPALVASGLPDLCSCATPVVPELGGGGGLAKNPLAQVVDGPVLIHTPPRRRYHCSSRRRLPPSLAFPTPPGAWERGSPYLQTVPGSRSCLRARFSSTPCPSPFVFNPYPIVRNPPLPSPFGLRCQGCASISKVPLCPRHPALGSLSTTWYRLGERLVEHADRVATPQKISGSEIIYPKTLRTGLLRRRSILWTSAPIPCRASGCDPPLSCVASSLAPRGDSKLIGLDDY